AATTTTSRRRCARASNSSGSNASTTPSRRRCRLSWELSRQRLVLHRAPERSARQQPGGIERRQGRIVVVDDQRDLRAAQHHGIAPLTLQPPDPPLIVGDRLRLEDALHQLIHDDAVARLALLGARALVAKPARRQPLGIDLAIDQPLGAQDADAL